MHTDELLQKLNNSIQNLDIQVKAHVDLQLSRSDTRSDDVAQLDERDVIELEFEGGIREFVRVDQLSDDRRFGSNPVNTRELASLLAVGETVSRGIAAQATLKAFRVIGMPLEAGAAITIAKHFESKGLDKGLYKWTENVPSESLVETSDLTGILHGDSTSTPCGKPLLVFLHGTASTTEGSFAALAQHVDLWPQIQEHYSGRVFAFEHKTLTESPIKNAIQLLKLLPDDTRLHLVSHSRGGLIGELLCRAFNIRKGVSKPVPFDRVDFSQFPAESYQEQRAELQELDQLLKSKRPRVERFVRVACPAAGTLLASDRLDTYFSLLVNVLGKLGFDGSELYDFVTSLAMATAKERANPKVLPGLECMVPDSPLVRVLNRPGVEADSPLAVIAGDIEGGAFWHRLKVWAADVFYREDHDLVVNTKAMYGGMKRKSGASRFFDQGPEVSHFNYFKNDKTARKLVSALTSKDDVPPGFAKFEPGFKPVLRSTVRSARQRLDRDVVYVIPGMMGSQLAQDGKDIWLNDIELADGGLGRLSIDTRRVGATGLVAGAYQPLIKSLERRYEVVIFPFDWRRSLLDECRRLAEDVEHRLAESPNQSIHFVAHSTGGLLVRALMVERGDLWQRLKDQHNSRIIMLGTPHQGMFSVVAMLLGLDVLVEQLTTLDFKHSKKDILEILRAFPGLLELMPLDSREKAGPEFETAQLSLDLAEQLQATLDDESSLDLEHMHQIVGKSDSTTHGLDLDPKTSNVKQTASTKREQVRDLILVTEEGDGRVEWSSCTRLGVQTWFADVPHGALCQDSLVIAAIGDVLVDGETKRLPLKPLTARGATQPVSKRVRQMKCFPDCEDLLGSALGFSPQITRLEPKVKVRIVHGDVQRGEHPVLVGHYHNDSIVATEQQLDLQLGGRLSQRHRLGVYPGVIDSNLVLLDLNAKPTGAIVVGLGRVGKLSPRELSRTITSGLTAFAMEASDRGFQEPPFTITTVLVGSGESGLPLPTCVSSILEGVKEANAVLRHVDARQELRFSQIDLMELHLDRAVQVSKYLEQRKNADGDREFDFSNWRVSDGDGGWRRVTYGQDKDWWMRLHITMDERGRQLRFVSHTDRARAESFPLNIQPQALDAFLKTTRDSAADAELGHTLFELLFPNQIKQEFPQGRNFVLVVDKESAQYPWELLQDTGDEHGKPLSVRSGLIRQMDTENFRETVNTTPDQRILVVGDPDVNDERFDKLEWAERESQNVRQQFELAGYEVEESIRKDFRNVFGKLYSKPYQVLHLAGHGVYEFAIEDRHSLRTDCSQEECPVRDRGKRLVTGMVLGGDVFLTADEVRQMQTVPELVFINCCSLGREHGAARRHDDPSNQNLHQLAANLGTALIEMGAKAVIAAGWEISDADADKFANDFYKQMLQGQQFGEAVKAARTSVWDGGQTGNTWGAYQCYGDPHFKLVSRGNNPRESNNRQFAVIDEAIYEIDNVRNDAEQLSATKLREVRDQLMQVDQKLEPEWKKHDAKLLESLGHAYGAARMFPEAIDNYERLRTLDKAEFSVKALEQLANLKCRWQIDRLNDPQQKATKTEVAREIRKSIDELRGLLAIGETLERFALIGSACKRLALVTRNGRRNKNLADMRDAFARARDISAQDGPVNPYPTNNWLAAHLLLKSRRAKQAEDDPVDVELWLKRVETVVDGYTTADLSDFWNAIAKTDLDVIRSLHSVAPNQQVAKENAKRIAKGYLRELKTATARDFSSIVEHMEFLVEVLSEEIESETKTQRRKRERLLLQFTEIYDQLHPALEDR